MAPPIPKRAQVRSPVAAILLKVDGYLGNDDTLNGCLHHHFRGELHSGRRQVQLQVRLTFDAAHSTVAVRDSSPEQAIEDPGQYGSAEVTMQRWHRALVDPASQSRANDEQRSSACVANEPREQRKIVGLIRITHEHM